MTVWKYYRRLYRSTRPSITMGTIVITGSLLFVICYHYIDKIFPSIKWNLYTRSSIASSIVECIEPSFETEVLEQFLSVRVPRRRDKTSNTSKQKLVLLWTKYFGSNYSNDYYFFQPGNATFTSHMCPVSDCLVTRNKSLVTVADALVFHQTDLNLHNLPSYRSANQVWIFYNLESPQTVRRNWNMINGLFNWTMSYREDSNVKAKYGEICRFSQSRQLSHQKNYLENKTNEVAWFASNCHSSSNREGYVLELSQYISIDIYGKCGTKTCLPVYSRHCNEDVLKNYKFYLSFENSICQGYATEKLFNILNSDIIPVVMGGADYEKIAPPNSYINVLDYPNPQKLAEYLKNVGESPLLYNSYFNWKGKYKIHLYPWMCELCEKLQTFKDDSSHNVVSNMQEWWLEKAQCMTWQEDGFLEINSMWPSEY